VVHRGTLKEFVEDDLPVAVYFASDMHLRLDRPERGLRLARWVESLRPDDELYLIGDVCDFWFASRQRQAGVAACPGLSALAAYRARGGALTILPGNHDLHLGPFYEQGLGARFVQEPLCVVASGLRLRLVHGHRAGGRPPWKAGMESRAFLDVFSALPGLVAGRLDHALERSNERGRARDEARLIKLFRRSTRGLEGAVDIAVFGHVHRPLDDRQNRPRLVILGGWHEATSYLRVDERGAELVVEPAHP
jgi:UDP-2,3-diacylglucosamine hydrolase